MKIKYVPKKFTNAHLALVDHANTIIEEYELQGYDLTLRQLYYQFVSRDLIENTLKSYKRLGNVINDARLAGLVSWNAIIDRTRNLESNPHWEGPKDFMQSVTPQFQIDKWVGQTNRVEVWVEKDALIGVIEKVCREADVSYFACRGYTSQSEMWAAGMRLNRYSDKGQKPIIIHLGDHDPSGVDMSRDIEERLALFTGEDIQVDRIALNMDQVKKYKPPPNPAKITDSRADKYIRKFGRESWELDALEPKLLNDLIADTIESYRDHEVWRDNVKTEERYKTKLATIAKTLK